MRKRAKASNSPHLWERFREMRRYVKSVIKTKKREYISNLTSLVKDKPKEFWKFFCSKTTRSSLPDTLVYNDKQFTSSEGKADAFNRFFASIFNPLDPYSDSSSPPPDHSQNILESITVSTNDVNCLISSLPADKSSGPDGISVRLLKECADEISASLTALFNMSLSQGKVPQEWKEANVVPVFKKGDVHDVSNYRSISLLSIVSKLLERVIHIHVSEFVKPSLSDFQHGLRKKTILLHSTSRCFS